MLRAEAERAVAPDCLDAVKRADLSLYREAEVGASCAEPRGAAVPVRKKPLWTRLLPVAAAAALVLIFVFGVLPATSFNKTVYATVDVQANARYEIGLNKDLKVIDIAADSDAGNAVLKKITYKKQPLDIVLTKLIQTCAESGYTGGTDAFSCAVHCGEAGADTIQGIVDSVLNERASPDSLNS
ncbi:hypothetical protein FACS1894211_09150 [Clostridia bacterium]|nr:hypothetical protein FACS1894211_09150 [Clostridia bacterium]